MKRVLLVEYMGQEDSTGKVIGHGMKVLEDYQKMIKEDFDVHVMITGNTLENLKKDIKVECSFKKNIRIRENASSWIKISNFLIKQHNIAKALKQSENDIIWFCNVDFALILHLFINRKKNKKVIITIYRKSYGNNLKDAIYNKVIKMLGLVIYTGSSFDLSYKNTIYIPDYFYDASLYTKYQDVEKEEVAVCLGTMNKNKKLEDVINIFNKSDYKLVIAGKFYDKKWAESIAECAHSNIVVMDRYLSNDEYLEYLAKAKYCVIPYDQSVYNNRTSGVLQECIFLNTVPISYEWFLIQNNAKGLKLENDELSNLQRVEEKNNEYYIWRKKELESTYSYEIIHDKLVSKIIDL